MVTQVNAFDDYIYTADQVTVFDRQWLNQYDCLSTSRTYSHNGMSYNHTLYVHKASAMTETAIQKWQAAISKVYSGFTESEED
jgi:hypothetical protein